MSTYPFTGKKVVVFGLARSGLATVSWLSAQGAHPIGVDSDSEKQNQARQLGAEIVLAADVCWDQVVAVVQSPGIPLSHPLTQAAIQHNIPILSDCDLFQKAHPEATIIGVTGTNGKSTTTALIGHILTAAGYPTAIGGNIGIPVLSLPNLGHSGVYVLELSSYQLEHSNLADIDIVAWLNISEDHLERHGSMEHYVQAKSKILQVVEQAPKLVIGIDDPYSKRIYETHYSLYSDSTIPVSYENQPQNGLWINNHQLYEIKDGQESFVTNLSQYFRLQGAHNHQNIAVAFGVCHQLGLDHEKILEGIATFPGLEHRQELVIQIDNIVFINDSKATNADAAAKALSVYDHIYWIAGGVPKSDGIRDLEGYFPKVCQAFLFGQSAPEFAKTLGCAVPHQVCQTLEEAVAHAYAAAQKSPHSQVVILFSPACASFDQFQDFEHRGRVFKKLVHELKESTC